MMGKNKPTDAQLSGATSLDDGIRPVFRVKGDWTMADLLLLADAPVSGVIASVAGECDRRWPWTATTLAEALTVSNATLGLCAVRTFLDLAFAEACTLARVPYIAVLANRGARNSVPYFDWPRFEAATSGAKAVMRLSNCPQDTEAKANEQTRWILERSGVVFAVCQADGPTLYTSWLGRWMGILPAVQDGYAEFMFREGVKLGDKIRVIVLDRDQERRQKRRDRYARTKLASGKDFSGADVHGTESRAEVGS